jgi:plastocyanin
MFGIRARRRAGLTLVGTLLALLVVGLAAASAATPRRRQGGSVIGVLHVPLAPANLPPLLSPYARPRYRPPASSEAPDASPQSAVIYLRGPEPSTAPAGARATVRVSQRNRTIIPHVTVVQAGTRVSFPNEDDVFHNIFSLSSPHRFNLGRYAPGGSKTEVFNKPGVVRLFCDIHSEMGGIILVLDTPWFVRPDADGRFKLEGVPPGEYTAVAWHEAAGIDSTRVVVTEGGETTVDFTLSR